MNKFWEKVDSIVHLSSEAKELLGEIIEVKSLRKGDKVLAEGSVCRHLYFVEDGLLRIYYLKDGKEVTEWIALDNHFCFSIISFFEKTPSRLTIECLENSTVVYVSSDEILKLCDTNFEIAALFRKLITGSLILSQVRMESIQFETASQRYKKLLHQSPEILRRVPLMYIASFLGVSFETLSRIRSQN